MESSRLESSSQHHDLPDDNTHDDGSLIDVEPLIPPYWLHRRDESYSSIGIFRPPPITLEDHTEEPSEQSKSLWAKGVAIDDYVTVSGNLAGVGDYVVWNCKVETLDVSSLFLPLVFVAASLERRVQVLGLPDADALQGRSNDDKEKVGHWMSCSIFLFFG